MPRVESYGPRRQSVQPSRGGFRTVRPDPDAFGAGFGRQVAQTAFGFLEAQQRQIAQRQARDADNALAAFEFQRRTDRQSGWETFQGQAAEDLPDRVGTEFDAAVEKVGQSVRHPRARQAFEQLAASRKQRALEWANGYATDQIRRYDQAQHQSYLENAVNNGIANFSNLARVGEERERIIAETKDWGARAGQPPEVIEAETRKGLTALHTGVIDRFLAQGQDRSAQAYYEEVQDQIAGEALPQIEKTLEEGTRRGEAQRAADAIKAAGGSQEARLSKARAIEDPKLRDDVEDRVLQDLRLEKEAARENEENLMVTAGNLIDQRGTVDAVPPGIWSRLTPSQKTALEQYAKRKQTGTDGDTDLVTYYTLMEQASKDPAGFAKLNLLTYIHKIGKTEFKELTRLQDDVRKGNTPKAEAALDGFRTNQQILDDTLTLSGIDRTKDKESTARLRKMLDERVMALQHLTGKKATNADVQQMADDLLKSVVLEPGSWWNILPGGAPFSDRTKRVIDLTVDDIPAADRRTVEEGLRRYGQPVTPESILNWYLQWQRKLGNVK